MNIHKIIRQRLLLQAGVIKPALLELSELRKTEWSSDFEQLMRNRLLMGAFRYGPIREGNKGKYDYIDSIRKRLEKYEQTGNTEYLVDIANCCLLCHEYGEHPNKHFHSIDDGEHVQVKGCV